MGCLALAFSTASFQWWWLNNKNRKLDKEAKEAEARGEVPDTFRFLL